MRPMSAADFLLSPTVQTLLKITLAEPTRPFSVLDLAKLAKVEMAELETTLAHLFGSGVLAKGEPTSGGTETYLADIGFVFYAELRRIALKSFAGAEPLRAMLKSKFKSSVGRAFFLGEDRAGGTLGLLIVYDAEEPEKEALDTALRKLLKSGAIRQHVQAHVIAERHFRALRSGDVLHAQLASDACVELIAAKASKPKPKAEAEPLGLLQKARQRLGRLGQ
jgi:hypothetical protein